MLVVVITHWTIKSSKAQRVVLRMGRWRHFLMNSSVEFDDSDHTHLYSRKAAALLHTDSACSVNKTYGVSS